MAMAKRAAKRIAPKTLEKMREKRKNESKNRVLKLGEDLRILPSKEDFRREFEKYDKKQKQELQLKRNRVSQIERQRAHLLNQPKMQNTFKDTLLLEYRTKAKTKKTKQARVDATKSNVLKTEEGVIINNKKHRELLKRNQLALNNALLEKGRAEILYYTKKQSALLNKKK